MAVLVVPRAASLGREVELIPPLELVVGRQRAHTRRLAADQVAAYGDDAPAALWPQRRDDVGGARSPVEAGERRLLDLQRIHQGGGVERNRRRLSVAERVTRKEAR